MRTKSVRYALGIVLCVALVGPGFAQFNKNTLSSQINQSFPDNNTGAITPATTRTFLGNLVNSFQQYSGVNAQVGTSYAIQASDYGQLVTFNNASAIAVTLPPASAMSPAQAAFSFYAKDLGAGTVTFTTTGGALINGGATYQLTTTGSIFVVWDGTNYQVWGAVNGPSSTTINDVATWGNTSGSSLLDKTFVSVPSIGQLQLGASGTPGSVVLGNATSGSITVQPATGALGSAVATLPAGTYNVLGDSTTAALTNKTFDSAATGNSLLVGSVNLSKGQYPGTTTNDNATTGNFGEYVTQSIPVGSAVSLSTGTAANIITQSLSAGDWDVRCGLVFVGTGTTNTTQIASALTTTSATLPTTDGLVSNQWSNSGGQVLGSFNYSIPPVFQRFSLSTTTNVFCVALASFTVSTQKAFGALQARRVR